MSFDENSPGFRRQSIYLFFKMRYTVYKAVEELKKAFHDITFKEIDAWFARFKTGSRDLVTDVVIDNDARGMESVPANLKRKIMESVDYSDQKSLLKTNQCFREILKADRRIYKEVKINLGNGYLALSLENEVTGTEVIRYNKREKGCEMRIGEELSVLPGSYIDEGRNRLKKAIEKQGTKIKALEFTSREREINDNNNRELEKFTRSIGEAFIGLNAKIHVEELTMILCKKEDLYPVLEGINVGSLKSVKLKHNGTPIVYKLDDTPSFTQHLAGLEDFTGVRVSVDQPLEFFASLRNFTMAPDNITPEALKAYKNKIVQSKTYFIHFISGDYNREEILAALEPFNPDPGFGDYDGTFSTPGKQVIYFKIDALGIMFTDTEL